MRGPFPRGEWCGGAWGCLGSHRRRPPPGEVDDLAIGDGGILAQQCKGADIVDRVAFMRMPSHARSARGARTHPRDRGIRRSDAGRCRSSSASLHVGVPDVGERAALRGFSDEVRVAGVEEGDDRARGFADDRRSRTSPQPSTRSPKPPCAPSSDGTPSTTRSQRPTACSGRWPAKRRPSARSAKIIAAEGEALPAGELGRASDVMMAHPLALQLRNGRDRRRQELHDHVPRAAFEHDRRAGRIPEPRSRGRGSGAGSQPARGYRGRRHGARQRQTHKQAVTC